MKSILAALVLTLAMIVTISCTPTPVPGTAATQPATQPTINYAQLEADAQVALNVGNVVLVFLPPADQAAGVAISTAIQTVLNKLAADRAAGLSPTQPDLMALSNLFTPGGLISQLEHLNTAGVSASPIVKTATTQPAK